MRGPLPVRYCGGIDQCRQTLAGSLANAAGEAWCADSVLQRPLGGITQDKISTQNRPTFQQVVEFPAKR